MVLGIIALFGIVIAPIVIMRKMKKGTPRRKSLAFLSSALCFVLFVVVAVNSAPSTPTTANASKAKSTPAPTATPTSSPTAAEIAKEEADAKAVSAIADQKVKDAQAKQQEVLARAKALATGNPILAMDASEVKATIKSAATAKWGTDYQMIQFEIGNETIAYNALKVLKLTQVEHDTMVSAIDKWHDDFQMVQFEYDNQMKAYDAL